MLKRSSLIYLSCVLIITIPILLHVYNGPGLSHEANEHRASHKQKRTLANPDKPKSENDEDLFCAVTNPVTGSYIDLSQLSSTPNKLREGQKQSSGNNKHESSKTKWSVRGWGYDTNFTLGICSSPVGEAESQQLSNLTGAFYVDQLNENNLVSIGDFSTRPALVGGSTAKKLTLKYENGSMCPNGKDKKATLLNFVCDKEIQSKAQISYIGNLHNCSYFFEVRSIHACPTSNKKNEVNVLGIFIGIFAIFFLVEFAGRRWIYAKLNRHLKNDDELHDISPSLNEQPHWDLIEDGSRWSKFFNGIIKTTRRFTKSLMRSLVRGRNSRQGGIRLRSSPSASSSSLANREFFRDMEAQNEIIDSLDINSHTTESDHPTLADNSV
ncbi:CLL_collapsed_G0056500.mRNA.1.CDS.1 [Saccharomyces cerevisiae]|uniref:K7_Mrl1p n=1 Tax=Saccharomyces cerevisiae (strain Kyokai no. 7 / NBRC 101557) TaxID=721032 RepID=G2WPP9_YEASK|nr:Mrl1p [Saccharomyces cerevisiae YJM1399]CAI4830501.1 CPI_1c_G0055710.mRNA.1.CDS.1 [Saccharomyces cerevisiae]GAA27042.1 K7_Mrl1p [Saccharomyces cerevisiae Kyokai no. 7]CAI4834822.1 ADQ_G0055880.mRNA.1.CDS.1 [Saccharomyces cerevisiae]CAI4855406.1 BDN_1c_G0055630.mRNA.1.CDS.1 [Saccharomyces cerevisiae]